MKLDTVATPSSHEVQQTLNTAEATSRYSTALTVAAILVSDSKVLKMPGGSDVDRPSTSSGESSMYERTRDGYTPTVPSDTKVASKGRFRDSKPTSLMVGPNVEKRIGLRPRRRDEVAM